MRAFYILLIVVFAQNLNAQENEKLSELLLKAYSSNDSSQILFNESKALLNNTADTANFYYFKYYHFNRERLRDSSRFYGQLVVPMLIELDSLTRLSKMYEQLHYAELRAGQYDQALGYVHKALAVAEKMRDTSLISLHLSDISIIYHDFEQYSNGVEYGKRAYAVMDKMKQSEVKYLMYANNAIAINFDDWNKADSALFYHHKNIELLKEVDDTLSFSFIYNNIGNTNLKMKNFQEAEKYIMRALEINKVNNSAYNLATNYTNLGTVAYEQGEFQKAKNLFKSAHGYADENGSIEKKRDILEQETLLFRRMNNFKKALEKQDAFYILRDSVFKDERASKIAEMEARFRTVESEKKLAVTRANLAESELDNKQKNIVIFGSLGLALILGLLGYLFYNRQKLRNRQIQKESELREALARIETQNKLQEQRLRISRDLHDNIGAQLTFVTSSLDNLKYGMEDKKNKFSNKISKISEFTTQTIYELRDTIWAMNKSSITFEDLQSRIANFIDNASTLTNKTNFNFSVASEVDTNTRFTSVQGMNIYRIIQESVNNALKYGKASKINVLISSEDNNTHSVVIEDNGIGFDVENAELGHGLNNMKKRATDLQGNLEIRSEVNKGTSITLNY